MTNKKQESKMLNEVRLSFSGKLFFAAVAAKLAAYGLRKLAGSMEEQTEPQEGESASWPFKLTGTPEQLSAVVDVIKASKEFQETLSGEGSTVETVIQKLNDRNVAKQNFEAQTGKNWPL